VRLEVTVGKLSGATMNPTSGKLSLGFCGGCAAKPERFIEARGRHTMCQRANKAKPKPVTGKLILQLEPDESAALAKLSPEKRKEAQHKLMLNALADAMTNSPHGKRIMEGLREKLKSQPTNPCAYHAEGWFDHAIAAVEDHLDYQASEGPSGDDCAECDQFFNERLRAARVAAWRVSSRL
jgi:hypothetical protein